MWTPENYTITAFWFPRLLGFVYFFAIGAFVFQIKGLLGAQGILPIYKYLAFFQNNRKRFLYVPTLFWWKATDNILLGVVFIGICFSISLILGIYPTICLGILFMIYLSIVSVGQDFLSFGWESFLLEITFYTFWMSFTSSPNLMMWICLNFLLFRFHIQAGAVKLQSKDVNWRRLTALKFHYQSQPLPNTWAWYVYKWPLFFHKISTFSMFVIECVVPFGLFLTDNIRALTGILLIGLQIIIWSTGNFSYLNHLTAIFSVIAFSDLFLESFFSSPLITPSPLWLDILLSLIGGVFIFLQIMRLWQHFYPHRTHLASTWLYRLAPFHLVNRYGLFAIMTTERYEIIIEGSLDGQTWKEYLFKYKPSEVNRRPRRISPYQPRIDWQMWFLPFDHFEEQTWFHLFLYHLLKGTPTVTSLLRFNPFIDQPPLYIRSLMYDYKFSSKHEKKTSGNWWKRELMGFYSPILTLKNFNSDA